MSEQRGQTGTRGFGRNREGVAKFRDVSEKSKEKQNYTQIKHLIRKNYIQT